MDKPLTDFEIVSTGIDGEIDIAPTTGNVKIPLNTVPAGLPPVLPTKEQQLENYLLKPERLPVHDYQRSQCFWDRETNPASLYSIGLSPAQTTLVVDRNSKTGKLLGFREELLNSQSGTAKNSTSLQRSLGPANEAIRGSTTNFPFWPGGLEEVDIESIKNVNKGSSFDFDLESNLLSVAPGFERGCEFPVKPLSQLLDKKSLSSQLNLQQILSFAEDIELAECDEDDEVAEPEETHEKNVIQNDANIDDIVKPNTAISEVVKLETVSEANTKSSKSYEWAEWIDVNLPVKDFYKRIPDMAYKWPFELDIFQKQAILRLERHENVFVAAHTSAGKTVVAEYAIALSMKHMTRTIYTSPIKALSNQKFRDFKNTFEDVGLITGDVQLHPEAACLIMTTEILRSMLYNGSDVIRDLEWVVFDEVHYINDSERGVVWEEVLIMLPSHVSIILLSATVPNTMEFADWVGRTKKRKVYVVSTPKRPVPLEHYLYTGNSSKTSNELFLLIDANKKFLQNGYQKACDAKKERDNKGKKQNFGSRGMRDGNPMQDKNVWLSIVEMLRKKDQLPIVAFTFSKKRIEDNANHMSSVDLLSGAEKAEVYSFFQRCISKLKGTDRQLPQVQHMSDMLKRGIGVHHSGVLPILKEVVEMLFQKGLVKVLFATETFAMGVNMPARTVVFDSMRKHDGTSFRDLLPGEYIQMAGRAGRRGLDSTGMVIILCKGDVPEMSSLHSMMMGKPTQLESQFRLTYTMILNLLRVEQLRIEDMMKHSFSEFHNQRDTSRRKALLDSLGKEIEKSPDIVDFSGDLEEYYIACDKFYKLRLELQSILLTHPQAVKALVPGRLIIIDSATHSNHVAVILKISSSSSSNKIYTVLVAAEVDAPLEIKFDGSKSNDNSEGPDMSLPRPVMSNQLFYPQGVPAHQMLEIDAKSIGTITTKSIKINPEKIIDDIRKRQIPRFKADPPGQSASYATQELLRIIEQNPDGLPGLDAVKDFHVRDIELVEKFHMLTAMQRSFAGFKCVSEANFNENFAKMRTHMKLKEQRDKVKFLLSDASLQLLPEYQQRVEVLRCLGYIDRINTVQLKGRVACAISNSELIITELVFENILTALHPTEIAAVLSCVVFELKRCSEPNLCPSLEQAKEKFLEVAGRIGTLQRDCGLLMPAQDYVEQFHFGLMEVVFEWARGMPFAEITELTDVQEGIIVRCIQRLDEVLRDVKDAARIIGDPVLSQKMEEASSMIKRDIVFAASLYTQ